MADLLACLPATVTELIRQTGHDHATILRTLRAARRRGLVTTTTHGRSVVWSLA